MFIYLLFNIANSENSFSGEKMVLYFLKCVSSGFKFPR